MQFIAVLDNIRSVYNVGSIFRTADAAGVRKIYCCGITPSPLDRFKHIRADFAKVALGAEKSVTWESARSTTEVLRDLKKNGWLILAVEQAPDSIPFYEAESLVRNLNGAKRKIALVLGAEVDGISPEVLALADTVLEIPMRGKKESLNVSVAFGIVAFGLTKPRAEL